ncbi:MAG: CRISPR-associated endonuclease Cas1, partial [Anaerolineales bacterium]
MPPLYLVQQNTKIRIRNRRVQVEDENQEPPQVFVSIPLSQVDQVVIFGNVGLTTPAINAFLEQNTEVIFLSQRGEFRGRLVGNITPHVPLRRMQYSRLNDADFTLKLAKGFVRAKLTHQRNLLSRHGREKKITE